MHGDGVGLVPQAHTHRGAVGRLICQCLHWWHSHRPKSSRGRPTPCSHAPRRRADSISIPAFPGPSDPQVSVGSSWAHPSPGTGPVGTDFGLAACGSRRAAGRPQQFWNREESMTSRVLCYRTHIAVLLFDTCSHLPHVCSLLLSPRLKATEPQLPPAANSDFTNQIFQNIP